MIVRKIQTSGTCALCHRTLLLGERAIRYSPGDGDWVDVCALCTDEANEHGWLREGSPTTPLVSEGRRKRRRLPHIGLLDARRAEQEQTAPEPMLRRLSALEQAMVEASELFDESPFKRTVAGIAKSLGEPSVSLLPLSGTNPEVVITVAWDISWYQYRVTPEAAQPVRLAERGHDITDLDETFESWNAHLAENGRLMPNIERL